MRMPSWKRSHQPTSHGRSRRRLLAFVALWVCSALLYGSHLSMTYQERVMPLPTRAAFVRGIGKPWQPHNESGDLRHPQRATTEVANTAARVVLLVVPSAVPTETQRSIDGVLRVVEQLSTSSVFAASIPVRAVMCCRGRDVHHSSSAAISNVTCLEQRESRFSLCDGRSAERDTRAVVSWVREWMSAVQESLPHSTGGTRARSLQQNEEHSYVMWLDEVMFGDVSDDDPSSTTSHSLLDELVSDITAAARQGAANGGILSARFEAEEDKKEKVILLDGLRYIRGVLPGEEDGVLQPRLAGMPFTTVVDADGFAAGHFVSPLDAHQHLISGSAKSEWFSVEDDAAHSTDKTSQSSTFALRRTIDLPSGLMWGAPAAFFLDGLSDEFDMLSNRVRVPESQTCKSDGHHTRALLPYLIALSTMLACRRMTSMPICTLWHTAPIVLSPKKTPKLFAFVNEMKDSLLHAAEHRQNTADTTRFVGVLKQQLSCRLQQGVRNSPKQASETSSSSRLERLLRFQDSTRLYWDPFCSCTGINIEAINFLIPLEAELPVQAVANEDCWCQGFPEGDMTTLRRLREPMTAVRDDDLMVKTIWVSHKPAEFMPTFPYHGALTFMKRPSYVIARTMIESDRWDYRATQILNHDENIDEVWVPAPFLVDVLLRSGVRTTKRIVVIPEAVDTHVYDPNRFETSPSRRRSFSFVSNFKWEPRKGWDILLEAYFTEFHRGVDNVTLTIKTFLYMDSMPRDVRRIQNKIAEFASLLFPEGGDKKDWRWVTETLPPVVIVAEELSASDMPKFYAEHDAFVLPSRGEGWGLPVQEAMAMGLPCITTSWSGMLGFATHHNAYLVDILGLEDATDQHHELLSRVRKAREGTDTRTVYKAESRFIADSGGLEVLRTMVFGRVVNASIAAAMDIDWHGVRAEPRRGRWAVPSVTHLKSLMRHVYDHRSEAVAVGKVARHDMMRYFSRDAVAQIVTRRLLDIRADLG